MTLPFYLYWFVDLFIHSFIHSKDQDFKIFLGVFGEVAASLVFCEVWPIDWIDWLIDWSVVSVPTRELETDFVLICIERIRIMGARRCRVEHKKRIPYLWASIYYFVYYISILLTRRSRLNSRFKKTTRCLIAGFVQWWKHSPSTNVAWVRSLTRRHMWCWICWFSTLLWEVFPRVLRFSPLTENQHLIWLILILAWFVVPTISKAFMRS